MRIDMRTPDGVFPWNGREDDGQVAPDGTYYFRVALIHQNRTIDLTGVPVKVKTVPPHPVVTSVSPALIPALGRQQRDDPLQGQREPRRDRPHLPHRPPRRPAGQELPDAVERPHGDLGREDRPAPRAGGHVPGRARRDRRRLQHRPLPRPRPARRRGPPRNAGVTISYLAAQAPLDPVPAGSDAVVHVRSPGLAYHWALERAGARAPVASGESDQATLSVHVPAGRAGLYEVALRSPAGSTTVPIVASGSAASPGARGAAGAHLAGPQPG